MLAGQLALITAAMFTGAAIYVSAVEQQARFQLDDRALLAEWKPAYKRGTVMQGSLAILGFLLGSVTAWRTGNWLWLAGAVVMLLNWPYTLFVILPINNRLMAVSPDAATPGVRELVTTWGHLHAVRTALGALAALIFLTASL